MYILTDILGHSCSGPFDTPPIVRYNKILLNCTDQTIYTDSVYEYSISDVSDIDIVNKTCNIIYKNVPLSLEQAKENVKNAVTARRFTVETGGVTLPNGTRINTGIDDQNRIATAIQGMTDSGINEVDFKAASGWVSLTRDELVGIAAVIAGHVQACFSKERALHGAVDAATTVEELKQIDVNVGWPGMEASRSEEPV